MKRFYFLAIAAIMLGLASCEKSDVEGGVGLDFNDDINWESLKRVVGMEFNEAEDLLERAGFEYVDNSESSGDWVDSFYMRTSENRDSQVMEIFHLSSNGGDLVDCASWYRESENSSLGYDYINDVIIGQMEDLFPQVLNQNDWTWYVDSDDSEYNSGKRYEDFPAAAEKVTDSYYNNDAMSFGIHIEGATYEDGGDEYFILVSDGYKQVGGDNESILIEYYGPSYKAASVKPIVETIKNNAIKVVLD